MNQGKGIEQNCLKCNSSNNVRINKIYAKPSKMLAVIAGLIFLIGSVIVLYFLSNMIAKHNSSMGIYAVALGLIIPFGVYVTINREELKRVRTFNQTYINGTTE